MGGCDAWDVPGGCLYAGVFCVPQTCSLFEYIGSLVKRAFSSLSSQGLELWRGNACDDGMLPHVMMCVSVCAVAGATAAVSASGSAPRKLHRGGGRVCVRTVDRLRQHRHHRRVPGAVSPRCVCVCVWTFLCLSYYCARLSVCGRKENI